MTTYASGMGPVAMPEVHVTGRRVLSTLLDGLVLGILGAVMSALFGTVSTEGGSANASLDGWPAVVFFVLVLAYYVLMEGYLGQTLGKMACGIRVVREDNGEVPGLGKAALRTLLRIVDGFLFYLVAFISVLATGKRQRLGDMAAGTLVVRK